MSLDAWQVSRVILTGARRTYSGPLGNHQVKNGVITLNGSGHDILRWHQHIAVNWQGFPEGDPRIQEAADAIAKSEAEAKAVTAASAHTAAAAATAAAQTAVAAAATLQENINGQGDLQAGGSKPNGQADSHGGVQSQLPGADQGAAVGQVAAGAQAGQAAAGPSGGNGSPEELTSPAALMKAAAEANPKLARALAQLNHADDAHWTKDGLPRLDVVETFYGSSGVKRDDVTAITGGAKRAAPRA